MGRHDLVVDCPIVLATVAAVGQYRRPWPAPCPLDNTNTAAVVVAVAGGTDWSTCYMHEHPDKPYEFILHDHDGKPLVCVSSTGRNDTLERIAGTWSVCLLVNSNQGGGESTNWLHVASMDLSADGQLALSLINPKTGEQLGVDWKTLRALLGQYQSAIPVD